MHHYTPEKSSDGSPKSWALEKVYLTSIQGCRFGVTLRVSTWRIIPVRTVRISPMYFSHGVSSAIWKGNHNLLLRKNENDDHGYLPSKYSFNCCSNHPTIQPYPTPSSWFGQCQVLSLAMDQDQCLAQQLAHYASRRVGGYCIFVNLLTDSAHGQPSFLLGIVL